jgi:hypothetical protein
LTFIVLNRNSESTRKVKWGFKESLSTSLLECFYMVFLWPGIEFWIEYGLTAIRVRIILRLVVGSIKSQLSIYCPLELGACPRVIEVGSVCQLLLLLYGLLIPSSFNALYLSLFSQLDYSSIMQFPISLFQISFLVGSFETVDYL